MRPTLFAVDDDPKALAALEEALRRRYGADYDVVTAPSATTGLAQLRLLSERGDDVALLVADQWMPEMTGIEFLTTAHGLYPDARRALLIDVGDIAAQPSITRALTLNQLDFYFGKPWASPEEEVYPVTAEALREWATARLPRFEKAKIIGDLSVPRPRELKRFLERNVTASGLYAVASSAGRALLDEHDVSDDRLPVVVLFDGQVLVDPSNSEIAEALGAKTVPDGGLYDVAIVGSGPAGLAAAVYGASEGLRTIVLESEAMGGQAGTSPRIRNYLGFPWGITGTDLTDKAFRQASAFGATFVNTRPVTSLELRGRHRVITLSNGSAVQSRTVVIATGVSYRRLDAPGVDELIGAGVFYGAAATEAREMRGEEVCVIGAGNSAGQAAIHLAACGARVTMLVRGTSLAKSMSDYLVKKIEATSDIRVLLDSRVERAVGEHRLEALVVENAATATTETIRSTALFVVIGAQPQTNWLPDRLARDDRGFILTGRDLLVDGEPPPGWSLERPPSLLETSIPGVFAAGDARHGSMKRVAAAVGEGATAIQLVRDYLDEQ